MVNNRLIRTIAQFPRRKLTRFKEFAFSPYFNKHNEVRQLIAYLSKIYPDFSERKCHRETIFNLLYPTLAFDPQKVAIIFTYAQRLLEQFLRTEEALDCGLLTNNTLLIRHLRENDFLQEIKIYWKENYKGVNKKQDNFWPTPVSADLEQLKELDETATRLSEFDHDYLQKRQPLLDLYYLTEKLKDGCELKQRSKLLNHNYTPGPIFQHILDYCKAGTYLSPKYPALSVFYSLYELLDTNSSQLYQELKSQSLRHASVLTRKELQSLFNALQNFCIGQINQGKTAFLRELFEVYQSQLDRELLLVNGFLPEWHYKNIVTTALRLEEHHWAIQFINKYREQLAPGVRDNAFSYNLAAYHYHLGRHNDVLKQLLQVEYTDLRYNLDAKSLLLRTYFDMDEEEALLSLSDAFRQFLKRNKEMTAFQKTGYYNMLKFIRKIFRLKSERDFINEKKWQAEYNDIKTKLKEAETVFNLSWLQRRLGELS